jgi:hypothetical protein
MQPLEPNTPMKQQASDPKPSHRRLRAFMRTCALVGLLAAASTTASYITAARASAEDQATLEVLTLNRLNELVRIRLAVEASPLQASPPTDPWD